jgi:DNA-binding NtrC family response regulator
MILHRVTNTIERHRSREPSRLRVIFGPDAGVEVALPAVGVVVGADPACDVTLHDDAVSKRHMTVVATDGGFEVTDLRSKNGTWLDGVSLTSAKVPIGTTIRVGSTLLQLLPSEEVIQVEPSEATSFGSMLGQSLVMRRIYALLERASATNASILLFGESGTGKELAARAIHEHSDRRDGPMVVFDCGAASETLIEGELFGHKKGAFTGAHADRAGAFARAHGGTLFLDEIGDLPQALQPKLLRLLERGEVTPLGANRSERYDVRCIAATHRDLWSEVARGTFRGDLYYRLAVIEISLPPLRVRPDDIAPLTRQFLRAAGASDEDVAGAPLHRLEAYAWPGNVRELRNVITRAVTFSTPGAPFSRMPILLNPSTAALQAPAPSMRADVPYHEAKAALLERFEKEYLSDLMTRSGENISHAARIAGLERKYLYKLLEKAGLFPEREGADRNGSG